MTLTTPRKNRWVRRFGAAACLLSLLSPAACSDPTDPVIEALLPGRGAAGAVVDVVGERFSAARGTVAFGGRPAEIQFWQDQRVRVRVPGGLSGQTLVVVTAGGTPSNAVDFLVLGGGADGSILP